LIIALVPRFVGNSSPLVTRAMAMAKNFTAIRERLWIDTDRSDGISVIS
jgi:hypothetical protein